MSERFSVIEKFDALAVYYRARPFPGESWQENYNVAPLQPAPVLALEEGNLELRLMTWGLIPFWAKDKKIAASMINAPAETIAEKPGFRDSFKDKRCLIPASGFYAWQKLVTAKQPYYVTPKEGLFTFAGLWSRWISPDSVEIESFTIATTTANDLVKPISDRMPAILPPESWAAWLSAKTKPAELQELLKPLPSTRMKVTAVSKYVNSLKSAGPKCIEAIAGH